MYAILRLSRSSCEDSAKASLRHDTVFFSHSCSFQLPHVHIKSSSFTSVMMFSYLQDTIHGLQGHLLMANLPSHVPNTSPCSLLLSAFIIFRRKTLQMIVVHHSFIPTLIDFQTLLASGNQQLVHEVISADLTKIDLHRKPPCLNNQQIETPHTKRPTFKAAKVLQ